MSSDKVMGREQNRHLQRSPTIKHVLSARDDREARVETSVEF